MGAVRKFCCTVPVTVGVLIAASTAAREADAAPLSSQAGDSVSGPAGRIVFSSDREENYDIYLIDPDDGTGEIRLTTDPSRDYRPVCSPDGAHIAFESDRDGDEEIYVMSADGSEVRRLTRNRSHESRPACSPDGAHIAFASNRNCTFDLYVMRRDGSGQRHLTDDPSNDRNPDWCCRGLATLAGAELEENGVQRPRLNQSAITVDSSLCLMRSSRVTLPALGLLGLGLAVLAVRGRSYLLQRS